MKNMDRFDYNLHIFKSNGKCWLKTGFEKCKERAIRGNSKKPSKELVRKKCKELTGI